MTKGLTITLKDLTATTTTVQLFNGQKWEIKEKNAFRYTTMYDRGKPKRVYFLDGKTEAIFNQIKILFDRKGRVIAQRIQPKSRLLTTKENRLFGITNQKRDQSLEIYALIMAIEEEEYLESITNYWYKERPDPISSSAK